MNDLLLSQISFSEIKTALSDIVRTELEKQNNSKPSQPETDYITRNETAQILGISLVTLNDWTKRGLVPSYRISSRIRYKKEEVLNSVIKTKYGR